MNPNPDPLEQLVHQTLRALPNQKAPSKLETRVLAEIARRQSRLADSRSWANWSAPLRWAFLILSAGVSGLAVAVGMTLFQGGPEGLLQNLASAPLQRLMALGITLRAMVGVGTDLVALIPRTWMYVGLGGFVLIYGILFGIGATAYRTLWKTR